LLTKATSMQLYWGLGALAVGVPLYLVMKYTNKGQTNSNHVA